MGPIDGVRVLDLTTVLMGPYATQILGDLGADVVKVESPDGDSTRAVGPARHAGMAGSFLNLNRNKRSVVLDLKAPVGRDALLRLAKTADVLVHNIRHQAMVRLRLTYEDVRRVNRRIIYCSATGYRRDGPYGHRPAYDDLIQGASGLAALIGRVTGTPAYVPEVMCDKTAGLTVVYAILAALYHRQRTGKGQELEVSMLETMVSFNLVEHVGGRVFEPPLGEVGYARLLTPFRRPFATADSSICLLPYSDRQWQGFFEQAGRPELARDPRFGDLRARTEHIAELYALLAEIVMERTTAEWMAICEQASIPATPVMDLRDAWSDPHLAATGFFQLAEHPSEGAYWTIGMPVRFAGTPTGVGRHAPRLGADTVPLLREAGYAPAEIDRIVGAPVSGGAPVTVLPRRPARSVARGTSRRRRGP